MVFVHGQDFVSVTVTSLRSKLDLQRSDRGRGGWLHICPPTAPAASYEVAHNAYYVKCDAAS